MKKVISLLLCLSVLMGAIPLKSVAIGWDTPAVPFIGQEIENAQTYINEKIDLAPIKLPKKIHNFELLEAERALAPNLLKDQIGIWTSPLRLKVRDLKWFIPSAGLTTGLLFADNALSRILTNNNHFSKTEHDISNAFSQIGGLAPTLGLPGGLILTGLVTKNARLRETGWLQYEGIVDSGVLLLALQPIFGRNKPNNSHDKGEFFKGSSSIPSGHALFSWTLASIAAHEYPDKKWVPLLGYTVASVISASRVTGNVHFVSDVVVSALIGYLVGKYVVKHNSQLSKKSKLKNAPNK